MTRKPRKLSSAKSAKLLRQIERDEEPRASIEYFDVRLEAIKDDLRRTK